MRNEIMDKLTKLMDEPDFSDAVAATESSADVIKLLSQYGIEITEAELDEILSQVPLGKDDELEESIISSLWARLCAIRYKAGGGGFSGGGGGSSFGGGGGGGGR